MVAPRWARDRPFALGLLAITLAAFAIRLVYALAVAPDQITPGDAHVYNELAHAIADGRGYNLFALLGRDAPTASHPPLYPLYLAVFAKLGAGSLAADRVVSCLLGTLAVALIGLLGRRLAGPAAGLLAAGLAAVYPQLFMVDGTVIAESLYAPLIAAVLLLAYRFLDRPDPWSAAALGAAIGLATLTRSDGILLLVVLALPLAWKVGKLRLGVELLAITAATTALVLAPWVTRNWIQFDRFPLLSTNGALTQLATNCPATYYGDRLGFVAHECALRSPCLRIKQEIPQSECLVREARRYVRAHLGRVPVVALARVGRLLNVYDPDMDRRYGQIWGREKRLSTLGIGMYALLVPLAVYGAVLLRRRRVSLLPLVSVIVLAMLVAVLAFGFSRYRLAAEPALVTLGAIGLQGLALLVRRRLRPGSAAA